MKLDIDSLQRRYRSGALKPSSLIEELGPELEASDVAIWIARPSIEVLRARAAELDAVDPASLPLYGIPFAVKDNIDSLGLPTTAACPDYAYEPEADAHVVELLLKAGAILVGKTNLDQFATGLVGVRSPYGVPVNPAVPERIPGGSSCGSAVAVAAGLASFSLGTDTAGSGRVPACFNRLWGVKPTRGLFSNRGVVPACRSLDCVSIFAGAAEDARAVLQVLSDYDAADAWARPAPTVVSEAPQVPTIGVPLEGNLAFFGDAVYEASWKAAIERFRQAGAKLIEVDLEPFLEAARLLYGGPWVAERYCVIEALLAEKPEAILPVTRGIIEKGAAPSAADCYRAYYELAELRRKGEAVWERVDCILSPTAGAHFTCEQVAAEPVQRNTDLGYYTNFMNLLDLSALAFPVEATDSARPFGLTLFAPAFRDESLLHWAKHLLGESAPTPVREDAAETLELCVCGAHMRELPLNHQLTERGGVFVREAQSAPSYRFYALAGGPPQRPAMVRVGEGGASIAVEIWRLPKAAVGDFLAGIPAPLALGQVLLEDGTSTVGFVAEAIAVEGASDITEHGGWRAWLQHTAVS